MFDNENNVNKYIKKKFTKDSKIINEFNSNPQIYRNFHIFRNNVINGLFREKDKIFENNKDFTFSPHIEKSLKSSYKYKAPFNSVCSYNYDILLKNKKKNLKEVKKEEKQKDKKIYSFFPSSNKNNEKIKVDKALNQLYNSSFRNIKKSNDKNSNIINDKNNLTNKSFNSNNNLKKMFKNNPLEKDYDFQKKIKEMKEARNQRQYEKIIKDKGMRINDLEKKFNETKNYESNERFVHIDEPLNYFKNTFIKYEKSSTKDKNSKKQKYKFEIYVENKPKKLIIYQGDDINYKIKEFCIKYKLNYNDKKQIINSIRNQIKDVKKIS